MRRRNKCSICPGHGRRIPVGNCQNPGCGASYCEKHGSWVKYRWLCAKCIRAEEAED